MVIFDYIFYRVAKAYFKRDGSSAITALISVSTVQCMLPSAFLLLLQKSFYSRESTHTYAKYEALFFVVCLLFALFLNHIKYKKMYFQLRDRWAGESNSDRVFRGIGVVLTIMFSWASVLILGILK